VVEAASPVAVLAEVAFSVAAFSLAAFSEGGFSLAAFSLAAFSEGGFSLAAFSLAAFSVASFSEAVFWSEGVTEAMAAAAGMGAAMTMVGLAGGSAGTVPAAAMHCSSLAIWSEGVTEAMAAAVVVVIMVAEELALEAVAGMGAAMEMVGLAGGSAGTVPAAAMRCSSLVTHSGL